MRAHIMCYLTTGNLPLRLFPPGPTPCPTKKVGDKVGILDGCSEHETHMRSEMPYFMSHGCSLERLRADSSDTNINKLIRPTLQASMQTKRLTVDG